MAGETCPSGRDVAVGARRRCIDVGVRRELRDRQRVRLLAAPLAQGVAAADVDRRAAPQVRQREGGPAVAAEGGAEQENSAWFWLIGSSWPLHIAQPSPVGTWAYADGYWRGILLPYNIEPKACFLCATEQKLSLMVRFCCYPSYFPSPLSPFSASATLVIPVSEEDMTRHATAIVVGQVKAIESYWDNQAGQIFTHIIMTPQEVLKGEVTEGAFTLKQLGGTVKHLRSWVDGSPEFRVGEKVLLFLDTNPDGSGCVVHLYQGKFSLFTDRDTGKEFAYRGETPKGVRLLTTQELPGLRPSPFPVSSMK